MASFAKPRVVAVVCALSCRSPTTDAPPPPPKLAAELADRDALARITASIAQLDAIGVYEQQSSVERAPNDPGVRLLRNGNKDLNNWICASRDAELGKPLVAATFDRPECEEQYVRGAVAARFVGAGEMVRFWMTALSMRGAPADDEVLRVYVDDEPHPVVEASIASIADGTAGEMFAPPFGAGTPRFVSWRYPVVFGSKLIVALDQLGTLDNYYHQTDVIRSDRPRRRAPARLELRDAASAALATARPLDPALLDERRTLAAATSVALEIPGAGTLTSLSVERPERLGDVHLLVEWDAIRAIELPLPELFAAALDAPSGESLGLAARDGWVSLRLPMPFATGARFTLENRGTSAAEVALRANGARAAISPARLFVERHETVAPAAGAVPLLGVDGAGRWVGLCAMLEGHAISGNDPFAEGLNFLEGDERVTIDGALSIQGTGTEDYFDSAFYFLGAPRATPFAMAFGVHEDRAAKPWRGRATACRFHVGNDVIGFEKRIEGTLEIGNNDPSLLDRYRTVAFYYR